MKRQRTFFIAGGGTGGHVYPALAIGRALQELDPQAEIFFVGTATGVETKIIPAAGFRLFLLPGGKLNFKGRWLTKFKTLIRLPWAFLRSARLLLRHPPQAVLGVGGYASGPFVLVASFLGFPTAIWEPNAFPGLTNRWLSRFVDRSFVVFEESSTRLVARKVLRLGMPVRQEIEAAAEGVLAANGEGAGASSARPFRIFCTGGSQGARAINEALFVVLKDWSVEKDGAIEVIHQIGSTDWERFQKQYRGFPSAIQPLEFVHDMPDKFRWADLVISRAGASTVAELAALGKVAILIPLPGAEAHQEKNAEALAQAEAAILLRQKDLTPARLKEEIVSIMRSPEIQARCSRNVRRFFEPGATRKIAQALIDLKLT